MSGRGPQGSPRSKYAQIQQQELHVSMGMDSIDTAARYTIHPTAWHQPVL